MKLPICGFDAKNSVLCPKCESMVESGELTKADIEGINESCKNFQIKQRSR